MLGMFEGTWLRLRFLIDEYFRERGCFSEKRALIAPTKGLAKFFFSHRNRASKIANCDGSRKKGGGMFAFRTEAFGICKVS